MILAADIGGTNSRFALCNFHNGKLEILFAQTYSSQDLTTLEQATATFLDEPLARVIQQRVHSACFSLAGPIRDQHCHLVNLGLTIDFAKVRTTLSFIPQIAFCNDLVAVGHGLSLLSPEEYLCLTPEIQPRPEHTPSSSSNAVRAVLAPGTGLGESLVIGENVYPSEGAHCDFGPRSEEEVLLWRFLHHRFGHVSYERILSGPGLQNIYCFLSAEAKIGNNVPQSARQVTEEVSVPSPAEISKAALTQTCPLCVHALDLFVQILGAEAGNLALKSLALGGVFLAGGIPPQILPKLQEKAFLDCFQDKGRFNPLLEEIPVYVILNDQTALLGAALVASRL